MSAATSVKMDFNEFLHELRGIELKSLSVPHGTFLSAGCAGSWYFDWIHGNVGVPKRHIGLEYYSPEPSGLPSCVEWIPNTAGMMTDVRSGSVDFVFSGQNIEHLWMDDVVGFLCEANRVLTAGGLLAMDSPNRTITKLLNWSHPEHTVEYTPSEISELLSIAGFRIESMRGIWLCQDPRTKSELPIQPDSDAPEWSLTRRLINQHANPENCFCWWVEATKQRAPDRGLLEQRVKQVFVPAFHERTQRLLTAIGIVSAESGVRVASNPDGSVGVLVYGPYMPVPSGSWVVSISGEWSSDSFVSGRVARLEVFSDRVLCEEAIVAVGRHGKFEASAGWTQAEMQFGVQFRLVVEQPVRVAATLEVVLTPRS